MNGNIVFYPNFPTKPKSGSRVDVRARVTCYNCYLVDKEIWFPVKGKNYQLVKRYIRHLKGIPHIEFEHYDAITGDYIFTVANAIL